MVRFYIVRHGQTLLNSLDRAQGWADSPLTEAGKQTAVEIGQKLKGIDFNAVYTSDMLRAVQTAELILEAGGEGGLPIGKRGENRVNMLTWRFAFVPPRYRTNGEKL